MHSILPKFLLVSDHKLCKILITKKKTIIFIYFFHPIFCTTTYLICLIEVNQVEENCKNNKF